MFLLHLAACACVRRFALKSSCMTADKRRKWLGRSGKTALVLLAFFMFLRWFEYKQTYHPDPVLQANASDLGRSCEDVRFAAKDGTKLHGWFFPANTNSPRSHLAVIFFHGNGGNISHRLEFYDAILAAGVNVFTFDYRGYGLSEGKPGEAGTYLDGQAAHAWLRQKGFAETNIIAFGESLGGGIASELVVREGCAGLILQSTFTSLIDLGAELYPFLPVRTMGSIKYDTHSKLPRIRVPVLILHSRSDTLISFHHAEQNFAAANEPKLIIETPGNHNDGVLNRDGYVASLEKYFNLLEQQRLQ